MSTIYLVSHEGATHADDVISTEFLKKYFKGKYDNILCKRTSDISLYCEHITDVMEKEVTISKNGIPSIIYDIGQGLFDHHQKDARVRQNGIKYCAFGLLWDRFGLNYLCERYGNPSDFNLTDVFDIFERDFVMGIDAHDNGQKVDGIINNISGIIARLRPNWDSDKATIAAYSRKSSEIASLMFDVEIERAVSSAKATPIVMDAINDALKNNRKYCILQQLVPHQPIILADEKLNHLLYTIYPSTYTKGEWIVSALPVRIGDYLSRKPLPKCLRALPKSQLMKDNWTFVHATGFMGAATSLEAAINLAEHGINMPDDADDGDILSMGEWPKKETKFTDEEYNELRRKVEECAFGLWSFGFHNGSREEIDFYMYSVKDEDVGLTLNPDRKYLINAHWRAGRDCGLYGSITKK